MLARVRARGAVCHMTPEVSDFIPGLLEFMNKNIEIADKSHVTKKRTSMNTNVQQ